MTSRAKGGTIAFVGFRERTQRVRPGVPLTSPLASARLRVLIPAAELAKRFSVYLVSFDDFMADPRLKAIGGASAVVWRKLSTTEVSARANSLHFMLEQLSDLAHEVRVIADVSDDYSAAAPNESSPELDEYQRALLAACDITVPCEALAERLRPDAAHAVNVIEDPFEGPEGRARAPRSDVLRLCWFGHAPPSQLHALGLALERVLARADGSAAQMEAVTSADVAEQVVAIGTRLAIRYPNFSLRCTPWSPSATWRALGACDIALLPQDALSAWGRVKSHNRLVEVIRAGRLAIASPIPSYRELADYAWVGEDPGEGLAWVLEHPGQALERVRAGQAHIRERFSSRVVADKWATLLGVGDGQAG